MALRWTAAGMLEAERQFRRIIGYRDLATLAVAIERDLARTRGLRHACFLSRPIPDDVRRDNGGGRPRSD